VLNNIDVQPWPEVCCYILGYLVDIGALARRPSPKEQDRSFVADAESRGSGGLGLEDGINLMGQKWAIDEEEGNHQFLIVSEV
jgi:hypothetical protein